MTTPDYLAELALLAVSRWQRLNPKTIPPWVTGTEEKK